MMDPNGANAAALMVFGVMTTIGLANLVDYRMRTMAEEKARKAESARLRKWGLPAASRPEAPRADEHMWHF